MLAFSALLLAALPLTAHAALAPRASPSPGDTYYRPPYSCSSSLSIYGSTYALTDSTYRTDTNSLSCEYSQALAECMYDTTTGALAYPATGCAATLPPTSGCVYECALTETGGSALLQILYQSYGAVQCEYWTGNQWLFCLYGNTGALQGSSGESSGHSCPQTASYQCDSGATRRGYRGVDNYTAWLSRRAERKAREAAPAPAPAAAPLVRRKYSTKH